MNNTRKVLELLYAVSPQKLTNSDIGSRTGIEPHQQVFQITRKLADAGKIECLRNGREWFFYSANISAFGDRKNTRDKEVGMNLTELSESYWLYNRDEHRKKYGEFLETQVTPAFYELDGLKFFCPGGVYHPTEVSSTRFIWRGLFSDLSPYGKRVLEVGTGCGALGICLAHRGHSVTMLDIDPSAVECARNNAQMNGVKVEVRQSDLFQEVKGQKYDFILFNPPLLDKKKEQSIENVACDYSGALFTRFMKEAKNYLAPKGNICVAVSNLGNRTAILQGLASYKHTILYSEFLSFMNRWRWLILAQPV